MHLFIPVNTTQQNFELILKQNKNITELYCSGCLSLTSIPNIEGLKELYCYECPLLTSVSNIEELNYLECSGCPSLTSIPNIEGLKKLYCSGCPLLTSIPNIEGLNTLYCIGCPLLKIENIGYLPFLKSISTDILNFKEQNLWIYKLKLIKEPIHKILSNKKAEGFTDNLIQLLIKY